MDIVDYVSLEPEGHKLGDGSSNDESSEKSISGRKLLFVLFILFIIITSDMFTNNIISWFNGAVHCNNPTSYGTVLQGIFFVLFYIIAHHLMLTGVL